MRQNRSVLLIEDSKADAHLFDIALHEINSATDYSLTHETRLSTGLEKLKSSRFEAVILDLNLPDAQGVDGLAAIRSSNSDIPVIVWTGHSDKNLVVSALKMGAQDFIFKNALQTTNLPLTIEEAISRHKIQTIQATSASIERDAEKSHDFGLEIETALASGQFEVRYETEVDLHSKEIVGTQAHIQWNHPKIGPVLPGRFIKFMKKADALGELQDWMMSQVVCHLKRWNVVKPKASKSLCVSLDLPEICALKLEQIEKLAQLVKETGLEYSQLRFEVNERLLINEAEACRKLIGMLSSFGFEVLVDGFEGNISLIKEMNKLHVEYLRFAPGILQEFEDDGALKSLIQATLKHAEQMRVICIAPSVKFESQLMSAREVGCHRAMGVYSHGPAPAATMGVILKVYSRENATA